MAIDIVFCVLYIYLLFYNLSKFPASIVNVIISLVSSFFVSIIFKPIKLKIKKKFRNGEKFHIKDYKTEKESNCENL
jgi:ABC-type bacteriocin/lantibiotic exporter with double-glycine peptidase domain